MARKTVLGLDIGSSSVKITQLKPTKRGYQLLNFGYMQLPQEAIVDGSIMNGSAVVDAIREVLASKKIKQKNTAVSVSGHSVILKKISLPVMTHDELEESIHWEAEQYIPFDINDVHLDVAILNEHNEQGQMDVLLVAAKKDMIQEYTNVVEEAGLKPMVVDVDSFALQNAFEVNYDIPMGETVALVNVGASVVNINCLHSRVSAFTRDISQGGHYYTEEIQKQLNVSYEEAEALKMGGLNEVDAVVPQEVERVMRDVSESIANDVQRSLDFFAATSATANIRKIYVAGGCAHVPALSRSIEEKTGVSVGILNPFEQLDLSKIEDEKLIRSFAPAATVSVGLALRSPDDR